MNNLNYAQIILIFLLAVSFFVNLARDINGRPAKPPAGFQGAVGTVIATAIVAFPYWKAFSL